MLRSDIDNLSTKLNVATLATLHHEDDENSANLFEEIALVNQQEFKSESNCDSKLSNNYKTEENGEELLLQNNETKTKEFETIFYDEISTQVNFKENLYLNPNDADDNLVDNDQLDDRLRMDSMLASNKRVDEKKMKALVKAEEFDKRLCESSQQNRMRLAIGLLLRLVLPIANGVATRLRNFRTDRIWKALRNLGASKQTITNMLAYAANTISLGLSSVQVSHRIDPLIKIIKLKKAQIMERHYNGKRAITPTIITTETETSEMSIETQRIIYSPVRHLSLPNMDTAPESVETAEQCITVKILAEPPPDVPIRADIILIHGLHGSLPNTWKQGLWSNERNPVDFERPPKPPLRPPKRPRYSRSNIFVPPHSNKKARREEDDNTTFMTGVENDFDHMLDQDDREDIFCFNNSSHDSSSRSDSVDSSFSTFSTFRLRLDDYETTSRPTSPTTNYRPKGEPNPEDSFPFEQPYSRCWPGDWLPLDCPGVRVIAVNYTTDPHLWRPVWIKKHHRSSMTERVRVMTEHLIKMKVGHGHPIVWVGHSKGGLFIKQILVDAWESGKLSAAPLWKSSRGVFFYSVPHRGSALADINLPFVRRSIELVEIEKNSKVLLDLHRRFVGLYYSGHLKVEVFSFVETAMTFMQVVYLRIVGVDSADPGIGDVCGLQLDHREICKPRSRKCILYTELVKMINKVC